MSDKQDLLSLGLKNLPIEEKKAALVVMDIMLKKLHDNGYMVCDFSPNHIYFQDGIYYFEKILPISSVVADNREEAILNNVIWMSILALWVYSPTANDNLIQPSFVSNKFDSFSSCYPEGDRSYYKSILVDSYQSGKIKTSTPYFSDYIIKNHNNRSSKNTASLAYVKATEVGKLLANDEEAAFGHNFFFLTVVASITVLFIGLISYLLIYLG
jgi:hypothetical protein